MIYELSIYKLVISNNGEIECFVKQFSVFLRFLIF